jgi:hypothetical protein
MIRPPPVLELRLQHALVGLDWFCPRQVVWHDQVYRFVSAIMYQQGHWSSRCLVDDRFYGGQILENETRLGGWKDKLHRLPDLEEGGWRSGSVAAPVRLYFIRDDMSRQETEWMDVTFGYRAVSPDSEPVILQQPSPTSSRGSPIEVPSPCNSSKRPLTLSDHTEPEPSAKRKRTTSRRKRCPLRDGNGRFVTKS